MSLRIKFALAAATVACLAIGLAAFGISALMATSDLIVRLYDRPLMGINYARSASATLAQARGLADRMTMEIEQPQDASFAMLDKMRKDILDDLFIVRQRVPDQAVAETLNRADASIGDWFQQQRAILSPSPDGLTEVPTQASINQRIAVATRWLDDLVDMVAANGFSYRTTAEAEIRSSNATLLILAGGIIFLSALFLALFARLLVGPIVAACRIAEDVAAGRIATIPETTRRDELGGLMRCLASMQTSLLDRSQQARALLEEKDSDAANLRSLNFRFDTALNNMSHGLLMCDANWRVVVVNRRLFEMYGIDAATVPAELSYRDLLALTCKTGYHRDRSVDEIVDERKRALQSGPCSGSIRTLANGRTIAVSHEPLDDGGWVATYEDISERRKSEEQIAFLGRHDALTQLPNRVTFQERLGLALAQVDRGQGFALLSLDLDGFKAVNDSLGHPAGDSVLRQAANRLSDVVREVDTVARIGGDEFSILQMNVTTPNEVAQLARRVVEVVGQPYEIDEQTVSIGVSVGIALAPGDTMHPVQLIKDADLALYKAKRDGRGTWRFFEPTMDALAKARRQLELELRNALPQGQLELQYQPIVSQRTRLLTGFEALLRWRHPTRGIVSPVEFIPVVEEMGLITAIGTWVIQTACAEAVTWRNDLRVAVNLSPLQFRSPGLVNIVYGALNASGLAPNRLELEITESVPLQDDQGTLKTLHELRALGLRITLDDFGTGYSSLSYLRSFPFDTLKIDRSFVRELDTNQGSAAIIQAIMALGNSLNMHVTAEGVETEAQFGALAGLGCTDIQGYLFSHPVPADELPALIEKLAKLNSLAFTG